MKYNKIIFALKLENAVIPWYGFWDLVKFIKPLFMFKMRNEGC